MNILTGNDSDTLQPTAEMYGELQTAYRHFNHDLFEGKLPSCLLTLQRRNFVAGYFSSQRFVKNDQSLYDEIALNPDLFGSEGVEYVLETLVHEMCHLWQFHYGMPGRGRYHNKEWAEKMVSVGLMPSDTGFPGGRQTGDHMSDYPIDGGAFLSSLNELLTKQYKLSWQIDFHPKINKKHLKKAIASNIGAIPAAPRRGESRGSFLSVAKPNVGIKH